MYNIILLVSKPACKVCKSLFIEKFTHFSINNALIDNAQVLVIFTKYVPKITKICMPNSTAIVTVQLEYRCAIAKSRFTRFRVHIHTPLVHS